VGQGDVDFEGCLRGVVVFLFKEGELERGVEKGGGEEEGVHTIVHLFPSSSFLGGFLTRMLSGLGFLPGAGLFPRTALEFSGTVEPARREGFLCVISDLSTFLSPLVTASPLLSSAKTALKPAAGPGSGFCSLILRTGGGPGGGGGGGGGAPPEAGAGVVDAAEDRALATSAAGCPLGFHGMPLGK
jgi:hypothetical protein